MTIIVKRVRVVLFFFVALITLAACGNKQSAATETETEETNNEITYFPAIDRYLVNEFGKRYAEGEHCVPIHKIVAVDERNGEDILTSVRQKRALM